MSTTTYVFMEKYEKYQQFLVEKSVLFGAENPVILQSFIFLSFLLFQKQMGEGNTFFDFLIPKLAIAYNL